MRTLVVYLINFQCNFHVFQKQSSHHSTDDKISFQNLVLLLQSVFWFTFYAFLKTAEILLLTERNQALRFFCTILYSVEILNYLIVTAIGSVLPLSFYPYFFVILYWY